MTIFEHQNNLKQTTPKEWLKKIWKIKLLEKEVNLTMRMVMWTSDLEKLILKKLSLA